MTIWQGFCKSAGSPRFWAITLIIVTLLVIGTGIADAAEETTDTGGTSLSPIAFFFLFLFISIIIGMVAVLGGVGGGVVFTPLMMGFTPIDSYIIRATGLFVALCGSLVAARPFLRRGLANVKLLFFAGVPYAICAVVGALLAEHMKNSMGDSGEAIIRLVLGLLVVGIAGLILFGGKRAEYPEIKSTDSFTERLGLAMSYWEQSIGKVVSYKVKRAPIGIGLFCGTGLISGLFGLGAGWAMVPIFNMVMLAPLKVAAASSKVLIGVGDTAAVWPYIMKSGIFVLFAVPCMIGLVIGTMIRARMLIKIKAGFVRYLIIALMLFSGIKLIIDGIAKF